MGHYYRAPKVHARTGFSLKDVEQMFAGRKECTGNNLKPTFEELRQRGEDNFSRQPGLQQTLIKEYPQVAHDPGRGGKGPRVVMEFQGQSVYLAVFFFRRFKVPKDFY